ncbi:guanylyl cyclase-activating protein 1-like [Cyprinus carpio]|uniref:Guanylyl cyclase-activating protein 1-like n=1 Tax=Cyprinus carpio TaxID=7962 RepID=A0A9Q9XP48_CYPCA|nr:guanylyl cyclase-activating protein 1-like [Cyprinus carpio]
MGNAPGSTLQELSACEISSVVPAEFMTGVRPVQLTFHEFQEVLRPEEICQNIQRYIRPCFQNLRHDRLRASALSLVLKGGVQQKLRWYFKLYDVDGSGCIDREELLFIFKVSAGVIDHHLTGYEFRGLVFWCIDLNGDGELSQEEFMEGIQADEVLLKMLTQSLDLTHVVKKIYSEINPEQQLH